MLIQWKARGMLQAIFYMAITFVFGCGSLYAGTVEDLCQRLESAHGDYHSFSNIYAEGINDIDADGLPDPAAMELINAVICLNEESDMADATANAFLINLALFDAEADADLLAPFRDVIADLMMISADTEAALKVVLADSGIVLIGDYVAVQCIGEDCTPDPVRGAAIEELFEEFDVTVRGPEEPSPEEPYPATGDLDGDGTDNLTEWNNVQAQGGRTSDFVVAATSPNLDGTEEIRTPGGGGSGCLIATAAYGTPFADRLDTVRGFRDDRLMTNPAGVMISDLYYRLSPYGVKALYGDGTRIAAPHILHTVWGAVAAALLLVLLAKKYRNQE